MFPFSVNGNRLEPDQFGYTLKPAQPFTPEGVDCITFRCPLSERGTCMIPVTLGPPIPDAAHRRWHWDGNMQAPTLSPSVNCSGMVRRCGWHGVIEAGCWKTDLSQGNS
jgi:hypothetical protein